MPSFTSTIQNLKETGPVVQINLAIGSFVEQILKKEGRNVVTPVLALAMIDTGASGTVINDDIVKRLSLQPVGEALINTPSSHGMRCYKYPLRLLFPNNVTAETLAIGAPLKGQHIQCLIDRDVLQRGVFIYTGYVNTFTLSF